jgi:hypothetical protein
MADVLCRGPAIALWREKRFERKGVEVFMRLGEQMCHRGP